MNFRRLASVTVITLCAAMALPFVSSAQEQKAQHHHYKLIDLGTFGGPNSYYFSAPVVESVNNKGMVVSRMIEDYEVKEIASQTGLRVEKFNSKFTAVGNLVAANDNGAVVSPILDQAAISQIKDVLDVEVHKLVIDQYVQVGALIVATNSGAAVYPKLTEKDVEDVAGVFKVDAYPASVNGGIPFLTSGVIANSSNAVVGKLTTGPELMFLTKALNV